MTSIGCKRMLRFTFSEENKKVFVHGWNEIIRFQINGNAARRRHHANKIHTQTCRQAARKRLKDKSGKEFLFHALLSLLYDFVVVVVVNNSGFHYQLVSFQILSYVIFIHKICSETWAKKLVRQVAYHRWCLFIVCFRCLSLWKKAYVKWQITTFFPSSVSFPPRLLLFAQRRSMCGVYEELLR